MRQIDAITSRIVHLLENCTCEAHFHQIKAQLILHHLHFNTTVARHFINASQKFPVLLRSSFPLFFTHLTRPHVFTCNNLLKAFSHARLPHLPYAAYTLMHSRDIFPNNYTFPFLLKSLSDFRDFKRAQSVHTHVVKLGHLGDIYVENSLLDVYASCGRTGLCRKLFDEMSERDVVSWTVLIMGYRNAKRYDEALIAFEMMQDEGVMPNRVTMVNVLGACASFGAVEMGVWIHDFTQKRGWEVDVILGTSLIDMFMKCGRIHEGLNVFRGMEEKNVFTWNAVIKGLAFAKCGQEAITWFNRMQQQDGLKMDEVTLVNVLSACSHSGLVDTGKQIFGSLLEGKYGFPPNCKHYACVIDLLARSGRLDEAFRYVNAMPFAPTVSIWGSLLAGCKAQGNLESSEFVAKKLVELEPHSSAHYVVLSNLYAEMGRWSDVARVRELMKERGLEKDVGCSSMEYEPLQENYYSLE